MANPKIKFKRSAVASKTPTLENIELGELALNTYDGKVFIRQDTSGVGIATTVAVVNPWTENYGATEIHYTGDVGVVGVLTANAFRSGNIFATGVTTSIGGFILRNPTDVSFDSTEFRFDDSIKPPSFDSSPVSAGIFADGSATFSGIVTATSVKASTLNLSGIPTYADESAASSGGAATGDVYKTSTGELRIKL